MSRDQAEGILRVQGIHKVFRDRRRNVEVDALVDVNLEVRKGEFICLVGTSGSGKTTLLRIIDGLERADAGFLEFNGSPLTGFSEDIAYVFQDVNLLPWRSVVRNVEIGLEARGVAKAERHERAMAALEMVDLAQVADSPPYTLSGGMQQRVGVARALAVEPKMLLMDEPFGQLDNFTRAALQGVIANLWESLGVTVVFVTHDVDEAIFLADRIAVFHSNPGRIAEIIDVPVPRPRDEHLCRTDPAAVAAREAVMQRLDLFGAAARGARVGRS